MFSPVSGAGSCVLVLLCLVNCFELIESMVCRRYLQMPSCGRRGVDC